MLRKIFVVGSVLTLVVLGAIQLAGRTFGRVRALVADPRARWMFVLTAVLLASNWLVFVWAIFIAAGVAIVLRERQLGRGQAAEGKVQAKGML